jgi:hypothetical protein
MVKGWTGGMGWGRWKGVGEGGVGWVNRERVN